MMSSINGLGNVGNTGPVQKATTPVVQKQVPADAPAQNRASDRVELSGVGHLLQALKTNNVRADKVASIKSQIESGTYEDDHKLNVATDKLLDDLLK
jgi:anti-sigma28 factor (negative regulator of flagellin synthesis)